MVLGGIWCIGWYWVYWVVLGGIGWYWVFSVTQTDWTLYLKSIGPNNSIGWKKTNDSILTFIRKPRVFELSILTADCTILL